jgi:hypothetical protein
MERRKGKGACKSLSLKERASSDQESNPRTPNRLRTSITTAVLADLVLESFKYIAPTEKFTLRRTVAPTDGML